MLGKEWDGLRKKMNLIKGLHGISKAKLHNASMPTTAAPAVDGGDDAQHRAKFPYSIDLVLSESTKVYPAAPAMRALRLTPGVSAGYSP